MSTLEYEFNHLRKGLNFKPIKNRASNEEVREILRQLNEAYEENDLGEFVSEEELELELGKLDPPYIIKTFLEHVEDSYKENKDLYDLLED